jgi:hypothetical protein
MLATGGVASDSKVQDLGSRMRCRECDEKGRAVISIRWAIKLHGEAPFTQDKQHGDGRQACGQQRHYTEERLYGVYAMRGYAWEKLYEAVHTLAVADGPLAERLEYAAQYLNRLKPDDFGDEAQRRKFVGIREDLTIEEPRNAGEGRIRATTQLLSGHDAHAIAVRIFELFMELTDRE